MFGFSLLSCQVVDIVISFGVWVFAVIGCVLVALFNVVCVCALFAYFRAGLFGFWVCI